MEYEPSDFYNPDVKIAFLKSIEVAMKPQTLNVYIRLFSKLKNDEEGYSTDLCNMNYDTLINVFNLNLSRGRGSRDTQLSLLRRYVVWCIGNSIKKSFDNPIQSIKSKDINCAIQIRTQFIENPERLEEILDIVLESENDDKANNTMDRMACWLMYEGFTPKELLELRSSNVDFNTSIISLANGKAIEMTNKLKELVRSAIGIQETARPNTHGGVSILQLDASDRLYRKINRKDLSYDLKSLRSLLSGHKKVYADETYERVSLSPERIWLSGQFFRIYQKEKRGEQLHREDFQYGVEKCKTDASIRAKVNNNIREYNDWKKAFDLL